MSLGAPEEFTEEERKLLESLKDDDEPQAAAAKGDPAKAGTEPQQSEQPSTEQADPETAAPETPAPVAEAKPQGDVRAALRSARRSEQRALAEAQRLKEENEALRKQVPTTQPEDLTDDEIAAMEEDHPLVAKAARIAKRASADARQAIAARPTQATSTAEPEFEPPSLPPETQEAVDAVPDLLAWQHDPDQGRFQLAVKADGLLAVHPKWKDKPIEERFKEVARRVRAELDEPSTETKPAPQATPRKDPKQVVDSVPRQRPSTLSDIGPGTGGDTEGLTLERMAKMSDEDIMNALAAGG